MKRLSIRIPDESFYYVGMQVIHIRFFPPVSEVTSEVPTATSSLQTPSPTTPQCRVPLRIHLRHYGVQIKSYFLLKYEFKRLFCP